MVGKYCFFVIICNYQIRYIMLLNKLLIILLTKLTIETFVIIIILDK